MREMYKHLLLCALLLCWGITIQGQTVIAEQNFNSISDAGTFCTDMLPNGSTLTNAGSMNAGTGLDGFSSIWFDTEMEGAGPVTSGEGGDFIGVNSFSADNSPNNAPDGTPVASGTEHNFEFNDVDGTLELRFNSVDLSGFSNRSLRLAYWINDTGYEGDDAFTVSVEGDGSTTVLSLDDDMLESQASADVSNTVWRTLTVNLEMIIASLGDQLTLVIAVSNTSGTENIFVDDIQFTGTENIDGCDEIFISEYIEGSSNNKCLELYNPTFAPITLDETYYLIRYSNGSTSGTIIGLEGTIAPGDVHVICNGSAAMDFLAQADQMSGSINHNGNDVYELYRIETLIDAIGQVGNDSNFGVNVTLVRKEEITSGDTDSSDAFDPADEYDAFPSNTSSNLGSHNSVCMPQMNNCVITAITQTAVGACDDAGTPYVDDDTFMTSIQVTFDNGPGNGDLVLEINDEVVGMVSADQDGSFSFDVSLTADGGSLTATAYFTADPSCTLTVNLGNAPGPCSVLTACDYLFFSEYVEGSGNNKCLEIYNPTDVDVDLSTYGVFLSFNGGSFETTVPLNGTVASGDVFVICNSGASSEFLALADATSTQINFNGDDAVLLMDAFGTIDAIGQRGFDPGSEWNNNGVGTRDETLRRNFFVQNGDNNPNDPFDPSQEWETYPQNTSFGLGYHGSPCQPSLGPGLDPVGIGGCNDRDLDIDDSSFSITTTCAPNNPYQDEQAAVLQQVCNPNSSVTAMVDVTPSGNAGITYRASLANNSAKVFLYTKANNRVYWSVRGFTGGIEQTNNRFAFNINWLRITRMGNVYRGFISADGVSFHQVFIAQVNLGECPLAGVAVYSYTDGVPVTGTFSNLMITDGDNNNLQSVSIAPDAPIGDLALSPNPASNWLNIAWPGEQSGKAMISIRDLNGRVVQQKEIYLEDGSIHLALNANLAAGMYVMSIDNGKEIWTKRFVKAE